MNEVAKKDGEAGVAEETTPAVIETPDSGLLGKNQDLLDNLRTTDSKDDLKEQPKKETDKKDEVNAEDDKGAVDPKGKKEDKPLSVEDRLKKVEEENSNLKNTFQERIDAKTANEKSLEAKLAKFESKETDDKAKSEVEQVADDMGKKLSEIKTLKRKQIKLDRQIEETVGGDDDLEAELNDLIAKEAEESIELNRLDRKRQDLVSKEEKSKLTAKQQVNYKDFFNGLAEAGVEHPELLNKDKSINLESEIWKEATRLLQTDAKKSKWATFVEVVNPKYDNSYGAYYAVKDAATNLSRKTDNKDKEKLKKEIEKKNDNEQLLTGGNVPVTDYSDNRDINDIEKDLKQAKATADKADDGYKGQAGLSVLKLINKKQRLQGKG